MIKVLYFGIAQEIAGTVSEVYEAGNTVDLLVMMLENHSGLKKVKFRLALNSIMLTGESKLKTGDVIALLPPFSGG